MQAKIVTLALYGIIHELVSDRTNTISDVPSACNHKNANSIQCSQAVTHPSTD